MIMFVIWTVLIAYIVQRLFVSFVYTTWVDLIVFAILLASLRFEYWFIKVVIMRKPILIIYEDKLVYNHFLLKRTAKFSEVRDISEWPSPPGGGISLNYDDMFSFRIFTVIIDCSTEELIQYLNQKIE